MLLVLAVLAMQRLVTRWLVPVLAELRSTELVVLFALTMLGGAGLGAYAIGLPPALGAFAAGLVLSGNRLTAQMDALVLPYRETFAAVFFVSLGTLMRLDVLWSHPLLCLGGLVGIVLLKTLAAAIALRSIRPALAGRRRHGHGLGAARRVFVPVAFHRTDSETDRPAALPGHALSRLGHAHPHAATHPDRPALGRRRARW